VSQTELNNENQVTPYGDINYSQTGTNADGTPQYTATTTLSAPMQQLADTGITNAQNSANLEGQLQNNAASTLSTPMNLGWNSTEANLDQLGAQTIDPQWNQQEAAMNQQLADQGVTQGSEAWNNAQTNFNNSKASAYDQLYLQGNQQAASDIEAQYNEPLNALSALQSGSQVAQPGVGTTAATAQTSVQPANYAGLVESNYQDQLSASNAAMGGLFGLGGSLLGGLTKANPAGSTSILGTMFGSDEDLKTDIQELGDDPQTGLPMYAYRYKGDPKNTPKVVGPMAQDVQELHPDMVREIGGHKVVQPSGDVARLFGLGGALPSQRRGGNFGMRG